MFFITVLSTILIIIYLVMIARIFPGLKQSETNLSSTPSVSIVIPFRNEEANLSQIIGCLKGQNYTGQWELILVNDHSQDSSLTIVQDKIKGWPNFRLLNLPSGKEGKKQAISEALLHANCDIIIQTDADCRMGEDWIGSLAGRFNKDTALVMGPVAMKPLKGFWSKFAALEFLSLQASGAAFALVGKPIMGSAACLAYRKSLLSEVEVTGSDRSSGDDIFLIQSVAKRSPDKVKFVLNQAAQTVTDAPATWNEFVGQRARWGSKTLGYPSTLAKAVAALIAGVSILLCALFVVGFLSIKMMVTFLILIGVKSIADFLFMRRYAVITGQLDLMSVFVPAALIYPFYICITGLAMLFRISWKGRTIEK